MLERAMSSSVSFHWETSISEISRDDWDGCFGSSDVRKSYDLISLLEQAHLPDLTLLYLVAKENGAVQAIALCFFQTTVLDIIAPKSVHRACERIRRVFPSFLLSRILVIGSPIATGESGLGLVRLDDASLNNIAPQIVYEAHLKAKQLRADLLVVKDISEDNRGLFNTHQCGLTIVPSLPFAFIPLSPHDERKRSFPDVLAAD